MSKRPANRDLREVYKNPEIPGLAELRALREEPPELPAPPRREPVDHQKAPLVESPSQEHDKVSVLEDLGYALMVTFNSFMAVFIGAGMVLHPHTIIRFLTAVMEQVIK